MSPIDELIPLLEDDCSGEADNHVFKHPWMPYLYLHPIYDLLLRMENIKEVMTYSIMPFWVRTLFLVGYIFGILCCISLLVQTIPVLILTCREALPSIDRRNALHPAYTMSPVLSLIVWRLIWLRSRSISPYNRYQYLYVAPILVYSIFMALIAFAHYILVGVRLFIEYYRKQRDSEKEVDISATQSSVKVCMGNRWLDAAICLILCLQAYRELGISVLCNFLILVGCINHGVLVRHWNGKFSFLQRFFKGS